MEYLREARICRSDIFEVNANSGTANNTTSNNNTGAGSRRLKRKKKRSDSDSSSFDDASLPPCNFERQLPHAMAVLAHAFALHRVAPAQRRRVGAFNILGIDWIVGADLRLHFVEANLGPGMVGHGIKWKRRMGNDLMAGAAQLTMLVHENGKNGSDRFELARGERFFGKGADLDNWWELVYSERQEACEREEVEAGRRREVYHPCPSAVDD